jgi:hypothetical protein
MKKIKEISDENIKKLEIRLNKIYEDVKKN